MPLIDDAITAEHVLGLDFGTTNLRLQVAHYDSKGRLMGTPTEPSLDGVERDGALPTVLELDSRGLVKQFGRPALLSTNASRIIVSEFKPSIGQSEEDLLAQGRPEN